MAVDSKNVYWTDFSGSSTGVVNQAPVIAGSTTTVATNQGMPEGIAVDSTNVYWVVNSPLPNTIWTAPIGGGTATQVATSGPTTAKALLRSCVAADGVNVYFSGTDSSGADGLFKVAKSGGTVAQIAVGAPQNKLVVDGANVYWVDPNGSVNQTTK
jgi:hypothetical protein